MSFENGSWQNDVVEAMINYCLNNMIISFTHDTLNERTNIDSRAICTLNAIYMGRRRAFALWPFLNITSDISRDVLSVQADAIAFRGVAYLATGTDRLLPDTQSVVDALHKPISGVSELPGSVIGYARRNTVIDLLLGSMNIQKASRRISDSNDDGSSIRSRPWRIGEATNIEHYSRPSECQSKIRWACTSTWVRCPVPMCKPCQCYFLKHVLRAV